jgi:hypothetical protein
MKQEKQTVEYFRTSTLWIVASVEALFSYLAASLVVLLHLKY